MAESLEDLRAQITRVGAEGLVRPPPALSAAERNRQRLAVIVGVVIAGLWTAFVVFSVVGD